MPGQLINFHREGSGSPLVLVHGIGATWQCWLPVIPGLAEHHDVIAVDLPGFGGSVDLGIAEPSLEHFAQSILDLMDSLGIERPEDDHVALLVNLLTDHVGGIPRFTQGERLDGEVYDLREAFDLATALDDGHGLIDASRVGVVHTEGIPEVWTNTVTRRVDAHHVSTVMQSEAEALHDALRRDDHRQAARCIEQTVQRALLSIRDVQARRKVAALIEISA